MMTLFLANVMGWFLVVVGVNLLFRHQQLKQILTEIISDRGLFFVFAVMTFIIGLLLVTSHNIWVLGWPVIITLLSWLVLINSLARIFFPETIMRFAQGIIHYPMRMQVTGVIFLIIGIYLLSQVYYPFQW